MDEILVDTTYLLPIFGLSVGLKNFEPAFARLLDSSSVRYNPVSLVEAKWIILRQARSQPEMRSALFNAYRVGLRALNSDERLKAVRLTSDTAEGVADELLVKQRVKDYFDRTIYGAAAELGCTLLTEDEQLLRIRREEEPRPRDVVPWRKATEGL